jgi:SPP1 gp7 family putative phage head morphogenesis protein
LLASETVVNTSQTLIKRLLNGIYRKKYGTGKLSKQMFDHTWKTLEQSLSAGWGKNIADIAYNKPDWVFTQNLRYNTAVFAAFKQNKEIQDAYKLLVDESGNARNWKQFYAEARKVSEQYNRAWLQTEYNQASQSAMTARKWQEFQENKDLYPNLKYVTAGDERVRDSHAVLDGKIYPIDHSFWDTYYPPNGWGCRCSVQQTDEEPNADLPQELPEMPEYMKNNPGKTARVFGESHPYYGSDKGREVMDFVRQQIKPAADITRAFETYQAFGSNYKKMYFNGNNGGYQVAHNLHNFDKTGGRYERIVGRKLADIGKGVEFMPEGLANRIDISVDGALFEIKGTAAKSPQSIKKAILDARSKGAEDMIIHMTKGFDFEAARKGIGRAMGVSDAIPNVWYFNREGQLVSLYKKSRP